MELKWIRKEWKRRGYWKSEYEREWVTMRKKENVIEKGFELKNEESERMDKED